MNMLINKKAQTVTLDLIVGISIFITAVVLFYYLFGMDVTKTEEEDAAAAIIEGLDGTSYFEDGQLESDEIETLSALSCKELKQLFETNKNVCIYVTDNNGHLVTLDDKPAIGCPGIEIQGRVCGVEGPP